MQRHTTYALGVAHGPTTTLVQPVAFNLRCGHNLEGIYSWSSLLLGNLAKWSQAGAGIVPPHCYIKKKFFFLHVAQKGIDFSCCLDIIKLWPIYPNLTQSPVVIFISPLRSYRFSFGSKQMHIASLASPTPFCYLQQCNIGFLEWWAMSQFPRGCDLQALGQQSFFTQFSKPLRNAHIACVMFGVKEHQKRNGLSHWLSLLNVQKSYNTIRLINSSCLYAGKRKKEGKDSGRY